MMGNVWEWNEKQFPDIIPICGFRGGSYAIQYISDNPVSMSSSDIAGGIQAWRQETYVGFRVASIPEPATILLPGLGSLLFRRQRSEDGSLP